MQPTLPTQLSKQLQLHNSLQLNQSIIQQHNSTCPQTSLNKQKNYVHFQFRILSIQIIKIPMEQIQKIHWQY